MKNHYFQMDDRALWSELRSGSLIALEVIYRRYYSLLHKQLLNTIANHIIIRSTFHPIIEKQ